MKKIFFEPLLHFFLFGGILFLIFNENSTLNTQNDLSLESYENTLLQVAISQKLHKEDSTIRNTLLRKTQQLLQPPPTLQDVSQERLQLYYKNNIQNYSQKTQLSFAQLFFTHADAQKAQRTLAMLETLNPPLNQTLTLGDPFSKKSFIQGISQKELRQSYGNYFALQVFLQAKNEWSPILRSKYGLHLVYITDMKTKKIFPFDDVQPRVYEDYKHYKNLQARQKAYQGFTQ